VINPVQVGLGVYEQEESYRHGKITTRYCDSPPIFALNLGI